MEEIVKNVNQLINEIKFFESQAVTSYWEIGKRLAQIKEQVPHGDWGDWIKANLGYSQSTANKLMQIYREIPNSESITNLSYTKVINILSLPEETRGDFIEKTNPQDLTVRELRKEIEEYKESLEQKDKDYNALKLEKKVTDQNLKHVYDLYKEEKNKPAEVVEVEVEKTPENIKQRIIDLESEKTKLQEELKERSLTYKQNESYKKQLDEKYQEINELKDKLKKIEDYKFQNEDYDNLKSNVFSFYSRVYRFLKDVGGLYFLKEYFDELEQPEKDQYLKALDSLEDWVMDMKANIKYEGKVVKQ